MPSTRPYRWLHVSTLTFAAPLRSPFYRYPSSSSSRIHPCAGGVGKSGWQVLDSGQIRLRGFFRDQPDPTGPPRSSATCDKVNSVLSRRSTERFSSLAIAFSTESSWLSRGRSLPLPVLGNLTIALYAFEGSLSARDSGDDERPRRLSSDAGGRKASAGLRALVAKGPSNGVTRACELCRVERRYIHLGKL